MFRKANIERKAKEAGGIGLNKNGRGLGPRFHFFKPPLDEALSAVSADIRAGLLNLDC